MSLLGKVVSLVQNETHLAVAVVTKVHPDGSVDVSALPTTHSKVQVDGEASKDQIVVNSSDSQSEIETPEHFAS